VGKPLVTAYHRHNTKGHTLERNLTNVNSVEKLLATAPTLQFIRESIQVRSHINVMNVRKLSVFTYPSLNTSERTLGRNHINVICVGKLSIKVPTLLDTKEFTSEGKN
jgi:hypothetical protein